ncbi:MAG: hypothetical protein AAF471_03580 [Myxococcota bacterium]
MNRASSCPIMDFRFRGNDKVGESAPREDESKKVVTPALSVVTPATRGPRKVLARSGKLFGEEKARAEARNNTFFLSLMGPRFREDKLQRESISEDIL